MFKSCLKTAVVVFVGIYAAGLAGKVFDEVFD